MKSFIIIILFYYVIASKSQNKNKLKQQVTQDNINNIVNQSTIVTGVCKNETCSNGICENENTCLCNYGFTNVASIGTNELCNYQYKEQVVAFFLELFLILGFGHLYCERYVNFIIKLIFFSLLISADFVLKYAIKVKSYNSKKSVYISSYVFYSIMILWQSIDIILFGLNVYKDYYGLSLLTYNS
jgi:hypothetical protein